MNVRSRWAIVLGLILATITSTVLISNNIPVVVKDANGVNQTFATIQTGAGALVAENGICDGQAAAACATVKGSSSPAAATDSAMVVALTPNSPAVTSPQAGSLTNAPIQIGSAPTLTTSAVSGSNFVAAVQIGSAPTLVTSAAAGSLASPPGTVAAITSNSASALVTPVNCINGCSSSVNVTGNYNQVPATLVSGGTSNLQMDQTGSLKVNITSQLASTLTVSPQAGAVSWPPGTPTGLTVGTAAANVTGSLVQGEAATAAIPVASGSVSNLLTDLNSNLRTVTNGTYNQVPATLPSGATSTLQMDQSGALKVNITSQLASSLTVGVAAQTTGGCTSQYITASTSSIITNVKQAAGTLCWLRIINASAISATVRLYDTASVNQQAVCGGSTLPVSYDLVQPNTVSPGLVGNLGTAGMAFANGIQLCLTGVGSSTFGFQDQTSLTTNALFVNIGVK